MKKKIPALRIPQLIRREQKVPYIKYNIKWHNIWHNMTHFQALCKNFNFKDCRILILKSIPLMRNPLLTQIVTKDPNIHTYSNSHSYFDSMKMWLFASSRVSIIGDKLNRIIIRFRSNFLTLKNVSWVFFAP